MKVVLLVNMIGVSGEPFPDHISAKPQDLEHVNKWFN